MNGNTAPKLITSVKHRRPSNPKAHKLALTPPTEVLPEAHQQILKVASGRVRVHCYNSSESESTWARYRPATRHFGHRILFTTTDPDLPAT